LNGLEFGGDHETDRANQFLMGELSVILEHGKGRAEWMHSVLLVWWVVFAFHTLYQQEKGQRPLADGCLPKA
jgi:hypothetical protein